MFVITVKTDLILSNVLASGPITSWQRDGETVETGSDFILGGSKITADGDCSHKIKRPLLLGRKVVTNLDSNIKKQRYDFANKGPSSQGYGFPSGHVWIWELDCEESWAQKNWCFWTMVLEKTVVPRTARRSNQSILKEISPGCSLEGLMLKLKLQYFGHLMRRADSLEETLMLGKIEGRRRRGRQRMRWLMASPTRWTWVWGGSVQCRQAPGVGDGQGGLPCDLWDCKDLDTTEQLNWTKLNWMLWQFKMSHCNNGNNKRGFFLFLTGEVGRGSMFSFSLTGCGRQNERKIWITILLSSFVGIQKHLLHTLVGIKIKLKLYRSLMYVNASY